MQIEQFQLHAKIEQRHWWFCGRRDIMRRLIARALPEDGARRLAIDVGCGTGGNIAALSDSFRCLGIDASADAIQLARQRFDHVSFRQGFAPDDLDDCFGDARLVTMMDVLEHVPDDFQLLSSLVSAASVGTQFLLTVPANLDLWSEHDESFGHYRRYDRERFAMIWQDLPVRVRLFSHFNARLYPLVNRIRQRNRRRGRSGGEASTDLAIPAAPLNAALRRIFAGEARRLATAIDQPQAVPYRQGVSLVALLERRPGKVEPRSKPATVAQDYFDPVAGELLGAV